MLMIKSLIFQVYLYISIFCASLAVLIPMPYSTRFSVARYWGMGMIWIGNIVCNLEFRVEGQEHIPDEPSVIMIRHSSVFEAYAQLIVFPQQTWIIKRELNWIPIFGWALKNLKAIPIDRKSGRTAVSQVINEGTKRLNDGIWITIFPEGTRMKPGETKKYGISGAALAKTANVKIIPVAHNAEDFWTSRNLKKKPGLIKFCIGNPITCDRKNPREITDEVKCWIDNKMREISSSHQ